ncbi:MAG: hypothetical protein Q7R47_02895 [Candidatus Diapherotrites archaeon]|nr:hypothetical protein [Candidatus Diapherotrites archaeon]
MSNYNFRIDDQEAVLREVGSLMPSILAEAIQDGFYKYTVSRNKDPESYPEYSDCTRGNQLYDRIAASARAMVDSLSPQNPDLQWKITPNKRATDILLDTRFAFRVKRSKRSRNNLTTGVRTARNKRIKPSQIMLTIGQMVMPFPSNQVVIPDEDRIWITVAFDLDDAEEAISKIAIGVELEKRFLWKRPLEAPAAEVVATLPKPVSDLILGMRQRRSA